MISVVTPSYNQGEYIEETIRSVLLQGYPNLEYIVIDGGSTDNTLEIISKYEPWISYWVSEKDRGQAHALNKGFERSIGELVGWQNSDDYYGPNALKEVALGLVENPKGDVFHGRTHFIARNRSLLFTVSSERFVIDETLNSFPLFPFSNQSMFFHRRIFESDYFLDESFQHAMDSDFIVRLIIGGFNFVASPQTIGTCRVHELCKSVYQEEIGFKEAAQICSRTFENPAVSIDLRGAALRGYPTLLTAIFRKGNAKDFRSGAYKLFKAGGLRSINGKLMLRLLMSLMGKRAVALSLSIRRALCICSAPRA